MNRLNLKTKLAGGMAVIILATAMTASRPLAGDKVTVEEVIAKHLESIGPAETRASIKTRIMSGTVLSAYRAPRTGNFEGQSIMASDGNKSFIGMRFENSA